MRQERWDDVHDVVWQRLSGHGPGRVRLRADMALVVVLVMLMLLLLDALRPSSQTWGCIRATCTVRTRMNASTSPHSVSACTSTDDRLTGHNVPLPTPVMLFILTFTWHANCQALLQSTWLTAVATVQWDFTLVIVSTLVSHALGDAATEEALHQRQHH